MRHGGIVEMIEKLGILVMKMRRLAFSRFCCPVTQPQATICQGARDYQLPLQTL